MSGANIKLLSYGDHPLQQVKVFKYEISNKKTVIYIHGGGWRDPNNTFDDFQELIQRQIELGIDTCNFFSINYRLSPEIKHPWHLIDILTGLNKIQEFCNHKMEHVSVVGHSVGATLILELLNQKEIISQGFINLGESPGNVRPVTIKFDNLVFLDGIYDVVDLLKEYPSYTAFVNEAFISDKHILDSTQVSSTTIKNIPFEFIDKNSQLIVFQSLQDELLSCRQTQLFVDHLTSKGQPVTVKYGNFGEHEQVYRARIVEELNKLLNLP